MEKSIFTCGLLSCPHAKMNPAGVDTEVQPTAVGGDPAVGDSAVVSTRPAAEGDTTWQGWHTEAGQRESNASTAADRQEIGGG